MNANSWNVRQAADFLGVSRETVWRLISERHIRAFELPLGKRTLVRIRKEELTRFIRKNEWVPPAKSKTLVDWSRTDVLPFPWAAALLKTDSDGVRKALASGKLESRRIKDVARCMEKQWRRKKRRSR